VAESIQQVLERRALDGEHPANPDEVVARFGSVAAHARTRAAARRRRVGSLHPVTDPAALRPRARQVTN